MKTAIYDFLAFEESCLLCLHLLYVGELFRVSGKQRYYFARVACTCLFFPENAKENLTFAVNAMLNAQKGR